MWCFSIIQPPKHNQLCLNRRSPQCSRALVTVAQIMVRADEAISFYLAGLARFPVGVCTPPLNRVPARACLASNWRSQRSRGKAMISTEPYNKWQRRLQEKKKNLLHFQSNL